MTREDIIHMAREAGLHLATDVNWMPIIGLDHLQAFEALVRADEREKTLRLWMLLDDVDTADDIAKADDDIYRILCRQIHAKRWDVLTENEVDAAIRARGSNGTN